MLDEGIFDEALVLHDFSEDDPGSMQTLEVVKKENVDDQTISLVNSIKLVNHNADDVRAELNKSWAGVKTIYKFQPLGRIRDYFGEYFALYFAWCGHFIHMIIVPTIIGLLFFFIGVGTSVQKIAGQSTNSSANLTTIVSDVWSGSFDNDLTPFYAVKTTHIQLSY